ncbi:YdbC family protein [Eremococcus coleocola]|uniref:Transcriptional coactivator p15 (PC4) C-terminal domain-containing protein n=1 Tax=Eremococcus coleocola ACS-139-V-Col8 TaxID=908337 RepID=E4KQY6_9LACT|nr:YdbC family protein [Eremococcus coleocola]EFR30687.1 hypothetical protein HMPREF9257_0696 [Eremococcus coleocola ACS-139-V-Col8]
MADFSFEIEEHYGQLSTNAKGWAKELTKVAWNGRPAKYDIRDWDPDYEKMGKGLTFTHEELKILRDCLNKMDLD